MRLLVPLIHRSQNGIGLMHHPGWRLGNHFQLRIGHDHRHFDDAIAIRIQTGHFHVQPDEVVCVACHIIAQILENPHFLTACHPV